MSAIDDKLFIRRVTQATVHIGVIALLAVWSYEIVRPFITVILWGTVIAIGSYPLYHWLCTRFGDRRGLAALVFTLLALTVVIVPVVTLSQGMADSAHALSEGLRDGTLQVPPPADSVKDWPIVGERVHEIWSLAADSFEAALAALGPAIKTVGKGMISMAAGTGLGVLQFVFAIIIAGLLLTHSRGGYAASMAIAARLAGERGERLVSLSRATTQSVVRGILGIALIQAILAGLGFAAIGLPAAGLWALICLVLAIVQVGVFPVLLPAALYVFSVADTGPAVLFLVWCIFVGVIDNVLKPVLLARGIETPMLVVLVGAVGGMLSFGITGLFVGPVILAVGYEVFRAWLAERDEAPAPESGGKDLSEGVADA